MSAWWAGLDSREKRLIQIAIGLTIIVIFWQFALNPALQARADARTNWAEADLRLAQLQEGYIAKRARGGVRARQTTQPSYTGDAFKMAVTRSATDKGLAIARLQGSGEETVGLVFEAADPRFIFFWLDDVENRLGGQISRLSIEQAGNGRVRARVDVQAAAAERP